MSTKICLMCEGSYPYVTGGVSSWVHLLMNNLPDFEFYISAIVSDRSQSGKFKYKFPDNLISINEIYLQDDDIVSMIRKKHHLTKREREAFRSFIMGTDIDWAVVFDYFSKENISVNDLLMGNDIFDIIKEFYEEYYFRYPFADFLWTYRSMLLPLCTLLKNKLPIADIYHSASTGYSGTLACLAKYMYNKPALITEHGIYTREREEDIIRSTFFNGVYKDIWIQHFYKLSGCAYKYSNKIISLFGESQHLQMEMGCEEYKTLVIPNGVDTERFDHLAPDNHGDVVNVGLIARISPIKDIKTLINSFAAAKDKVPKLNLYIMGGIEEDNEFYNDECVELVETLGLKDVYFTGNVDMNEYMPKLDIIILTSISEGQPMAILEAMSASKPVIATKVGNCEGLIMGEREGDLPCGIVTPIMSIEKISNAIIELAQDPEKRKQYGENGKKRVTERYPKGKLIDTYRSLYTSLINNTTFTMES